MKYKLKKIDLAKVTNIPPRRILDWTQKGILEPIEKASGQGRISYYSPENAVQAKVLDVLLKKGISITKFSDAIKIPLKEFSPFRNFEDRMYSLYIIDDCRKVFIRKHRISLTEIDKVGITKSGLKDLRDGNYETLIVVNLKKIMQEVIAEIENL